MIKCNFYFLVTICAYKQHIDVTKLMASVFLYYSFTEKHLQKIKKHIIKNVTRLVKTITLCNRRHDKGENALIATENRV